MGVAPPRRVCPHPPPQAELTVAEEHGRPITFGGCLTAYDTGTGRTSSRTPAVRGGGRTYTYLLCRGLAKAGSREPYIDNDRDHD